MVDSIYTPPFELGLKLESDENLSAKLQTIHMWLLGENKRDAGVQDHLP
jgi:hypothetical protein